MTDARRRIDVISDPAFLANISEHATTEIRDRRRKVRDFDSELSYQRRLIQERLDILSVEQRRRTGAESRTVLEALRETHGDADHVHQILQADFVALVPALSTTHLEQTAAVLSGTLGEIDEQRRRAQHAYDTLGEEISRRYRLGQTSVDELLRD